MKIRIRQVKESDPNYVKGTCPYTQSNDHKEFGFCYNCGNEEQQKVLKESLPWVKRKNKAD